jgi:sigma-B regulation protein RsbQ
MVFAHGFGCDQNMWRLVAPAFEEEYRTVLFDYVGHGQSDRSSYDRGRYGTLEAYAEDLLAICAELELEGAVFVGHSVSAVIGLIAAEKGPAGLFERMVLVGPSPRYVNEGAYVGGFTRAEIDGLLEFLDSNHLGWSSAMAPTIMGHPERPELGEELANSFCRTDPEVAKQFARATFLADNREEVKRARVKALILQCREDVIAPLCVGEYMHAELAGSELVVLETTGHCPHLSAPAETVAAIKAYLAS